MFTMDVGEAPHAGAPNEGDEGHNKLEDMVRHLIRLYRYPHCHINNNN